MSPKGLLILALACGFIPAAATARKPDTFDVALFTTWTVFDNSLQIDDFFASGGSLSVGLWSQTWAEAEVSHTVTNGPPGESITYRPIRVRFDVALPVSSRVEADLGAGYVNNLYGDTRSGSESGVTGLAGFHYAFDRHLSLKLAFVADYIPSPANEADNNWNIGLRQGIGYRFGKAEPEMASLAPAPALVPPPPPAPVPVDPGLGDDDRDGVTNSRDRCPESPRGEIVDADGCPLDSDKDGVTDRIDRCPGTPAGTIVDASGCPLDSDGDGVPDGIDRCPHTTPGTRVGVDGCFLLFEESKTTVVLEGVHFEHDKSILTPDSETILRNVAESLVANPGLKVRVEGHTSSPGSHAYNLRLSDARAASVRSFLVAHGVDPDRLVSRGYGPDQPVDTNETAEGQARNRRVELERLDGQKER